LKHKGFLLLDSQFTNEHLVQFGAIGIRRGDYKRLLARAINKTAEFPAEPGELDQVLDPVHRRTQTS
ncbi:MAG: leucyl/phenylalanyl-tRNA--protein transferase, partial [Pseudomonadota bacterium]|nr:leucyl/phenylalanyl-tRNA--protein transferase [Pseudomonadota bacterium]